jgi:type III restriction enzyme
VNPLVNAISGRLSLRPPQRIALATGVGKTRLMGAFIAYLHRALRVRHFSYSRPT